MSNLLLDAIPAFLLSLWLDRRWASRRTGGRVRGFETRDTLASLGMGVGNVIISALSTLGAVALWQLAYQHRRCDVGRSHALCEAVNRLPSALEWLLNTPSHHRGAGAQTEPA